MIPCIFRETLRGPRVSDYNTGKKSLINYSSEQTKLVKIPRSGSRIPYNLSCTPCSFLLGVFFGGIRFGAFRGTALVLLRLRNPYLLVHVLLREGTGYSVWSSTLRIVRPRNTPARVAINIPWRLRSLEPNTLVARLAISEGNQIPSSHCSSSHSQTK